MTCIGLVSAQGPSDYYVYIGSIAVYAIDRAGMLSVVEYAASGGRTPRNFSIDPTGRYVFCSNQDTEHIVVLRVGRATGRLTPTGVSADSQSWFDRLREKVVSAFRWTVE